MDKKCRAPCFARCSNGLFIKTWVKSIEVLRIKRIGHKPQSFAESLEVNDLPLTEELNDIAHIGVIDEPQNVVVGYAGFLLWYDFVSTIF